MTADTTIQCATDGVVLDGTDPLARVIATQAAKDFLTEIKADHGEVLFHQSGGCCDGSSPMCY
ncbi:MAG: DUF779 domain-containing protein, partial [Pseudomonadota bacterium]